MADLQACQKALDKAKIQLMTRKNTAFITSVCFSLKHVFDEKVPTAGTDGVSIFYNPDFFMAQTLAQQLGLILHETWHVAFDHVGAMSRLGARNPAKANVAMDYVINNMLTNAKISLPHGGLVDHQYDNMSFEEVYDLLPDNKVPPEFDMDLMPGTGDPAKAKQVLDEILIRAKLQAQVQGDDPGSIPGAIQVYIQGLVDPKLPWNRILRKYFNSMVKSDYSFRRPNRRFLPKHYLPSTSTEPLVDIALAMDMSGSVSDEETKQFAGDTYSILKQIKPTSLKLIQFDSKIISEDDLKSVQDLRNVSFTGRGGTLIQPVLDWAKANKPNALVIFTDGHFRNKEADPGIPIIWIIHNNPRFTSDYGKVIHYTI